MSNVAALPPTAPRLPFFGNALTFLREPLGFLTGTRERHGDVVNVAIGPLKVTLVSHPDLVEDILVTRNRLWKKDRFLHETLRPVLGDGLLSSEGDFWRRQRRLAQPAFHRDRIAGYADIMVAQASRLALIWRPGATRDVHADMMRLTLEIVAETLFGTNVGDHAGNVGEALESVLHVVTNPLELFFPFTRELPTPGRRRFDRAVKELDAIIYGVIEKRRAGIEAGEGESNDLLSMLLHAKDDDGSRMSDKQLRDECMTLFLAGHETTAINLSWTWLLLSQHPEGDAKLKREIDDVLGDRPATFADLPKLRYASHVIAESLRLWFLPEPWEGDLAKTLHRYAYFPFGGGPRFCIGQAFAQMEAVLLLVTLARSFRVEATKTPSPLPSVTLRPRNGLRVNLRSRS